MKPRNVPGTVSTAARLLLFLLALGLGAGRSQVAAAAGAALVPAGSVWRYLDDGSNQGTAWRSRDFDDSGWSAGAAELGYGDGGEATLVGFGPDPNSKFITTYFRRAFTAIGVKSIVSLSLDVFRDDGIVVYLNGTEIHRNNMPTGTIGSATTAGSAIEPSWYASSAAATALVEGSNVLAVEIHQANGTSSDISFDLALTANSAASVLRGPYLQMGTPGSVIVRWRTDAATNSLVRFGTDAAHLDLSASDAAATTEHAILLTGLTANTRYFYSVGSDTATLSSGLDHFFYTSPPADSAQPVRLWVLGDSGTADANQRAVRDAYENLDPGRYTDLVLLLGDNAYNNGTDAEYQAALFDIYPALLQRTFFWPALGNHDTAQSSNPDINTTAYFSIFTLPTAAEAGGVASGTEKYYSFDFANIHFVCLDSMTSSRSTTGAMHAWLEDDLAANTRTWLIAFWHHPPYTKGSHNSDTETALIEMRTNFLPLLESYGVDLVLGGHSHSYERSYLIDGHYGASATFSPVTHAKDPGDGREDGTGAYAKSTAGLAPHEGAVYAVAGSSGKISGGTLDHPAMFISLNQLGSMVLDIDSTRLDARFLNSSGVVADHFTILKGPQGNLPPTVAIASPLAGGVFTHPDPITVNALALDSDGSIARVDFFVDGILLGSDLSSPYSLTWTTVSAGNHVLSAVATDDGGATGTSAAVPIVILLQGPPTELVATPISPTRVDLSWTDNAPEESGYSVERSLDGSNFAPLATLPANSTSYRDLSVSPGTAYFFRVRAFTATAVSDYSPVSTATTPVDVPVPPSELSATGGNGQVALSWAASPGAVGYSVRRGLVAGGPYAALASGLTTPSYTDVSVANGTTYYYVVTASNAGGESAPSNEAVATPQAPPAPPSAPANLAASTLRATDVGLIWTDTSSNEQGFQVERSTNNKTFTVLTTTGPNVGAFIDASVTANKSYYYRVRAFNGGGNSPYSNTLSVKTPRR